MPKIQLRHDTSTNWATYNPVLLAGEVGVETDTNKMKIGDGTTAYNSLDYFVGDIDLSAYYNKTQTDGLLSEKQDILTPNAPLTISTYSKSNLVGLTYTNDGLGVYSANGVYYNGSFYNWSNVVAAIQTPSLSMWNSGNYGPDSWKCYVDIPYTIGQIAMIPSAYYCTFGKLLPDGTYIPFDHFSGEHKTNQSDELTLNSDGSLRGIRGEETDYITGGNKYITNTSYLMPQLLDSGSWSFNNALVQMFETENGDIKLQYRLRQDSTRDHIYYTTFANNGARCERYKEVNVIRCHPFDNQIGISASSAIPVSAFALYTTTADMYDIEDYNAIVALGNTFDISGEQAYNYLDLHIGSGLAVQNGNLINTNPTAITVDQTYNSASANPQSGVAIAGAGFLTSIPTASTSTLGGVKVDGTTITIDSNGVISSSGGGGGTVDQTYDATSTNAQSGTAVAEAVEDKVDNSDLADITEIYPTLSGLGMPSDTYEDLTFTHGASYIAPADGYFSIQGYRTNGSPVMGFLNVTSNIYSMTNCMNTDSSSYIGVVIPAHKGDTVQAYNYNNVTSNFKFVYAIGSESEAS